MKLKSILLAFGISGILLLSACSKIKTEEVEYRAGDTVMKGLIAYDSSTQTKRPGILVVHEWWGNNEYARKRARMLAEMGYTALALDMYGDGHQAHHPDEAGRLAGDLMKDFDKARVRFIAAEDFLKKQPTVDATRIGAIGYCFGGGVVLNMARQGADLRAVVSFHGNLKAVKPAKKGDIKAKLLVHHGADDKIVPPEELAAFKKEMIALNASMVLVEYKSSAHSFTNPDADKHAKDFNLPMAYNRDADKESWSETGNFLNRHMKR